MSEPYVRQHKPRNKEDRNKPEKPVAVDGDGIPIFGYVTTPGPRQGMPCCNSRRPGKGGLRCQSTARMANGRCQTHGGKSVKGTAHPNFRTGLYAKGFSDKSKVKQLIEAVNDPNYTKLHDEIGLNTLEIESLTRRFENGLDDQRWSKLLNLVQRIEKIFFSKQVMAFCDIMRDEGIPMKDVGNMIEELVLIVRGGADERQVWKDIGEAAERRRKLVETETKRNMLEANNMPADQVLHLFDQFVEVVLNVFKNDEVGCKAFAASLDEMSGFLPGGNAALGGRPGVMGKLEPQSALGERVRHEMHDPNVIPLSEGEYVDLDTLQEKKTSTRKLNFGK